ncbi:MAG TPA: hypothetical protein VMH22_07230 [bacterium]|nr:hypothetical protein [bacterium]
MVYIVRALVFLLETALNASGMTMTLAAADNAPQGGTALGTAPALSKPVRTLVITRGQGETMTTFWTGYWTLAT